MEKVNDKIDDLTKSLDELLYYDRDEFKNANIYNVGKNEGINQRNIEIAKKMLAKGKSLEEISEFTELSLEEIKNLQE